MAVDATVIGAVDAAAAASDFILVLCLAVIFALSSAATDFVNADLANTFAPDADGVVDDIGPAEAAGDVVPALLLLLLLLTATATEATEAVQTMAAAPDIEDDDGEGDIGGVR